MRHLSPLLLAAVLAGFTSAAAAETWDMPTPYPEAEFHTKNIRQFVEEVKQATDGSLEINVHSGQSLFKHPEIKRAVQTGQVPIAEMLMANLLNENAVYGADAVPFLASSYEEARRLWEAQKPSVEKLLEKDGLKLLYVVPWPGQGLYTKKELNSGADLQGVRFRTYNAATARMAELLGAVPTIVEAVEIPQAFSTGIVDGMVTSAATGVRTKAWDYVNNFYDTQAWLPKNMVFVNLRAFRSLDDGQREALLQAAEAAEERGWEMSKEASGLAKELAANGMKVREPSEQLREDLRKIGDTLTEEWMKAAGEDGEKIIEAYRKSS